MSAKYQFHLTLIKASQYLLNVESSIIHKKVDFLGQFLESPEEIAGLSMFHFLYYFKNWNPLSKASAFILFYLLFKETVILRKNYVN